MNEDLPKLLRAMAASTDAKASNVDIIFSAAATQLEQFKTALGYVASAESLEDAKEIVSGVMGAAGLCGLPRCDCGSLFEICRYPNCPGGLHP